jgi:hypothetical protein
MRQTALPTDQRLHLLRDALGMLDARRHPGVRAETAAMLCETLLAEGARLKARGMIAEAATTAMQAITTGPLPAGTRVALVSALQEAVMLLAGSEETPRALRRTGRGTPC